MAYHVHWSLDAILALEHPERRAWATEIARLNRRLNDQAADAPTRPF